MANPLFGQFGGNQNNPMSQFMGELKRLQQTVANPRKVVEDLLQQPLLLLFYVLAYMVYKYLQLQLKLKLH